RVLDPTNSPAPARPPVTVSQREQNTQDVHARVAGWRPPVRERDEQIVATAELRRSKPRPGPVDVPETHAVEADAGECLEPRHGQPPRRGRVMHDLDAMAPREGSREDGDGVRGSAQAGARRLVVD